LIFLYFFLIAKPRAESEQASQITHQASVEAKHRVHGKLRCGVGTASDAQYVWSIVDEHHARVFAEHHDVYFEEISNLWFEDRIGPRRPVETFAREEYEQEMFELLLARAQADGRQDVISGMKALVYTGTFALPGRAPGEIDLKAAFGGLELLAHQPPLELPPRE